jgi:hypothetical protein
MSDNRIIECMERAQYLLGNLMAVKPGEEVLIVVDPQTDERMTQAMAAAALNCGAEYGVYMMPIRGKDKATFINIQTRSRDHNDRVISLSNISVLCGRIIKCTGRKRGIRRLCRCITCSLFPCCRNCWNCNQKVNRSRRCIHKCRLLHSRWSDRPYMCRFLC